MNVPKHWLIVDLETSGSNPFQHDALAAAFVPLQRGLPTLELYVRPRPEGIVWNEFARSNFDSYRREWEAEAITPEKACDRIEEYVRNLYPDSYATPVGHNVGFDQAFLRKLAFLGGREQLAGISHRGIDTHTLLNYLEWKGRLPSTALTSTGAFAHFDIPTRGTRHTALTDALATRELIERLLCM